MKTEHFDKTLEIVGNRIDMAFEKDISSEETIQEIFLEMNYNSISEKENYFEAGMIFANIMNAKMKLYAI